MLPVLEPQAVGVDTTEDDGGDDDAVVRNTRSELCFAVSFCDRSGMVSLSQFVRRGHDRKRGFGRCILDGELAPEVCCMSGQQEFEAN